MRHKRSIVIEKKNSSWHRWLSVFYDVRNPEQGLPGGILDFYDVVRADGLAKDLTDKLYGDYLARHDCRLALNNALKNEHGHLTIKKYIVTEAKNMLLSLIFGQKAAQIIGGEGPVFFIPKYYVPELNSLVEEKKVLAADRFVIPGWFKAMKMIEQTVKIIINTVLVYFYPLIVPLSGLLKKKTAVRLKKSYKYGIYLRATDCGISNKPNSMDFMIKEGIIDKQETLFVIDGPLGGGEASYLSALKERGYDYCQFSSLARALGLKEYYLKIYPQLRTMRQALLASFPVQFFFTRVAMNMLQTAYLWEIFYAYTTVRTFIARQEPGGISRALLQKKQGSSNVFLYLSSTHHENSAVKTYYTLMAVDKFVSSKIPVEEFQTLDNYIAEYCDLGVINADLVRRMRAGQPVPKRVVTIFDDNSDTYSTYSFKNMRYYLEMVINMVERYQDVHFFYKPRVTSVFARDEALNALYKKLTAHPRCRVVLPTDPELTAIDLMARSELVLTVYTSSTMTESLSSGIKTVCYKPKDAYEDDFWTKIENMPYVCAHDQAELETNLDYWLLADREREFDELMEKHIKPKIDGYCDGRALERLKKII